MKESVCIICGKKKNGLEVNEDYYIKSLRWFKRNVTRGLWPEHNYRLVVCKEDYPRYAKYRRAYEKRQTLYLAVGIILAVILIVISPDKLSAVFYGIGIIAFLFILTLLTYTPSLKLPAGAKRP